jgi:uridine kinase
MNAVQSSLLIAIVGGSGAGKGWVVSRLCQLLGERAAHLQLDDFYRDRSHLPMARRGRVNFDVPHAIDWEWAERALRECRAGRTTVVPRYDFATHCRLSQPAEWTPRPVVFVDGLWLLRPPAVRSLFDLTIYLDTPTELRHQRRLVRDVAERGYSAAQVERQLRTAVAPMHQRYVEPQKKHAHVVLAQPFQDHELRQLAERLWTLLHGAGLVEPWMHETFRAELFSLFANHEYRN